MFDPTAQTWYAAEFIEDEHQLPYRQYSPIYLWWVRQFADTPERIQLAFHDENYPEGTQEKVYVVDVLERGDHFLLGRSIDHDPRRLMLIYEISWTWLGHHFDLRPTRAGQSVQDFLGPR